uniref:CCDC34 domain-containing protein n=1 Tax=Mesocestoides corti TaxID=53468 RepID=A0A5K3EYZ7_MESCO
MPSDCSIIRSQNSKSIAYDDIDECKSIQSLLSGISISYHCSSRSSSPSSEPLSCLYQSALFNKLILDSNRSEGPAIRQRNLRKVSRFKEKAKAKNSNLVYSLMDEHIGNHAQEKATNDIRQTLPRNYLEVSRLQKNSLMVTSQGNQSSVSISGSISSSTLKSKEEKSLDHTSSQVRNKHTPWEQWIFKKASERFRASLKSVQQQSFEDAKKQREQEEISEKMQKGKLKFKEWIERKNLEAAQRKKMAEIALIEKNAEETRKKALQVYNCVQLIYSIFPFESKFLICLFLCKA